MGCFRINNPTHFYSPILKNFGEIVQLSEKKYSYGFNGQEKDNEVAGDGNDYYFKYRISDSRLGRFFSIDPLARKYSYNSPYAFCENRVMDCIELEGLEATRYREKAVDNVPVELGTNTTNSPTPTATSQVENYNVNNTGQTTLSGVMPATAGVSPMVNTMLAASTVTPAQRATITANPPLGQNVGNTMAIPGQFNIVTTLAQGPNDAAGNTIPDGAPGGNPLGTGITNPTNLATTITNNNLGGGSGGSNLMPNAVKRMLILTNGTAQQISDAQNLAASLSTMNPTAQIAVATINAPPGTPSATASLSTNQLILVRNPTQDFVNNNYGTLNYVRNFQDQATNSRPMIPTAPLLPLR